MKPVNLWGLLRVIYVAQYTTPSTPKYMPGKMAWLKEEIEPLWVWLKV